LGLASEVVELAVGERHSCAVLRDGGLRCWGWNQYGQVGWFLGGNLGDDETPASKGDIRIGGKVVHVALGAYLANYAWNQSASEKEFRLAIQINPKYETAHHWLGNMPLQAMGRFPEAITAGKLAETLDPRSQIISADTGQNLFFARRYPEAILQFKRALDIAPNFSYAHYYLGATFHASGMFYEAINEYRTSLKLNEDPYVKALLIRSLVKASQRDEALKLLDEIEKERECHYVQSVVFALAYGALGDTDKAFEWLDKDVKERAIYPAYYSVDPTYDDLKDDSRFKTLIQRVALAKMELAD